MSFGKRAARFAVIVVVLCVVAMGALYAYISSGGLIARKKPSGAETMIARWMVRASVPQASKMLKNPLISDSGGEYVSAGRDLYKQKCETCHGYDGSGKTEAVARSTTRRMGNYSISSGTASETPPCRAGRCRIKTPGVSLFSFGIYPRWPQSPPAPGRVRRGRGIRWPRIAALPEIAQGRAQT